MSAEKREHFDYLVSLAMQNDQVAGMKPVIEKEILHYDILHALSSEGILKNLTFQGGTALRLCYGSNRYSEDLDFASGKEFRSQDVGRMSEVLTAYISDQYGFPVSVKSPITRSYTSNPIIVHRWQVNINTTPDRKDLPSQRIKIEIANIPAHTKELRLLASNYRDLAQGVSDVLIPVQSLDEIMADKLLGFAESLIGAPHKPPRYRDLWDLVWMMRKQAQIDLPLIAELVDHKIDDYQSQSYEQQLKQTIELVPALVASNDFHQTMRRFLPKNIIESSLMRPEFQTYLATTLEKLMVDLYQELFGGEPRGDNDDFTM